MAMGLRRSVAGALVGMILCLGAAPKPAETIPPLSADLVAPISAAIPTGQLRNASAKVDDAINAIVSEGKIQQPERLIPLGALRTFTKYFSKISKPSSSDTATLQWLLTRPRLLETLMQAVSDRDEPAKVLTILSSLRQEQPEKLDQYADLTVAICVVWDRPYTQAHAMFSPIEKSSPARPRQVLRYYMNAGSSFRYNPQQLPWQLGMYLVDNLAGPDEMAWADAKYAGRAKIGAAFFDVTYDYDMLDGTTLGRLADKDYTLENIFKNGGICGDQAYYAAQVARSVGVPAVICTGTNANEGTGHAWVGCMSQSAGQWVWDFDEGRYPENRYWRGSVVDPQSRDRITDADVSMLAELMSTPARDRMTSIALCSVADMVSASQQPAILMQAINLSPGNRVAWKQLAQLAGQQKLSAKELSDFGSAVNKFAVKDFPDFAYTLLKTANSGRGTDQQIKALSDMERMFNSRPDLQADVYVSLGDLYQKTKNPQQAYAAYAHVLDRYSNVAPIVMEAMDHLDKFLREARELNELANVYSDVWRRMPQPDTSAVVRGTPFYRLGERYEKLLRDLGDQNTAQSVRARLDSMTATATALKSK